MSEGAAEEGARAMAIRSMGLSELKPFDPKRRSSSSRWNLPTKKIAGENGFAAVCNETLSDSPAPGGGSGA